MHLRPHDRNKGAAARMALLPVEGGNGAASTCAGGTGGTALDARLHHIRFRQAADRG